MMRVVKFLLIGCVTLCFAGCAHMPWHKSKQPPPPKPRPVMTKKAAPKSKPMPKTDTTSAAAARAAAASAEPPAPMAGSEAVPTQPGADQTQTGAMPVVAPPAQPAPRVMPGPASKLPSNQRMLAMSFGEAWSKVGTALQSSGYRIMQHDRALGAMFIIDVKANAGVIKPDTPIYQVKLTEQGNQTKLAVLNSNGQAASPRVTVPLFSALTQKGI